MDRLSKPIRRLLAVSLLLALLGGLAELIVIPYVSHVVEVREHIAQERLVQGHLLAQKQRDEGLIANSKRDRDDEDRGLFLDGESDPIRLANLQSLVSGIVTRSNVKLRSSRNLTARERSDVRFVGLQLQFSATIEQLQNILVTIENQQPYLFIESLHVTPMPGAIAAGGEATGQLDARLDIIAATGRKS
jgi:hypothetical protein